VTIYPTDNSSKETIRKGILSKPSVLQTKSGEEVKKYTYMYICVSDV